MDITLGMAIEWKYPDKSPHSDFIVTDLSDGNGAFILVWNLSDPQPTPADIDSWRFGCAQSLQLELLQTEYLSNTYQPIQSSALGTPHTYLYNSIAKTRYDAIYARFHNDSNYTSEDIYTLEAGNVAHSKDQFTQVWTDAFSVEKNAINRYDYLVKQIKSIQLADYATVDGAIAAIQSITWDSVSSSSVSTSSSTANMTIS